MDLKSGSIFNQTKYQQASTFKIKARLDNKTTHFKQSVLLQIKTKLVLVFQKEDLEIFAQETSWELAVQ